MVFPLTLLDKNAIIIVEKVKPAFSQKIKIKNKNYENL